MRNLAEKKGWTLDVTRQVIADHTQLTTLAVDAGLPVDEVRDVLSGTQFAADVHRD